MSCLPTFIPSCARLSLLAERINLKDASFHVGRHGSGVNILADGEVTTHGTLGRLSSVLLHMFRLDADAQAIDLDLDVIRCVRLANVDENNEFATT